MSARVSITMLATTQLCCAKSAALRSVLALFAMVFVACGATGSDRLQANQPAMSDDLQECRQEACSPLQEDYARVVGNHPDDAAIKAFQARLELVDGVAAAVLESLQRLQATAFKDAMRMSGESLFDGNVGVTGRKVKSIQQISALSAREILNQYKDSFQETLLLQQLTLDDCTVLRKYYEASVNATADFVMRRGCTVAAMTDWQNSGEARRLCQVIPFLVLGDSEWSAKAIERLPEWMRTEASLAVLEDFSLQMERPLSAFRFASYPRVTNEEDLLDYLCAVSDRETRGRKRYEYGVRAKCLETAIGLAKGKKDAELAVGLTYQAVALFAEQGHSEEAAKRLACVLWEFPTESRYGKTAVLRVKYLCAAQQYDEVIRETSRYRTDPRCASYMGYMLYAGWEAARRGNHAPAEVDERLAELRTFSENHSMHELGSYVKYATAMNALVKGERAESVHLLSTIDEKDAGPQLGAYVKYATAMNAMAKGERDEAVRLLATIDGKDAGPHVQKIIDLRQRLKNAVARNEH